MKQASVVTAGLAAGLLLLSGCAAGDSNGAASTADPQNQLTVEAGDLYFDPEVMTATAGTIEFTLVNVGAAEHDLVIEEPGDTVVAHTEPGETVAGTIGLNPGTYTFYCSVPGHRSSMEGTLEVE